MALAEYKVHAKDFDRLKPCIAYAGGIVQGEERNELDSSPIPHPTLWGAWGASYTPMQRCQRQSSLALKYTETKNQSNFGRAAWNALLTAENNYATN